MSALRLARRAAGLTAVALALSIAVAGQALAQLPGGVRFTNVSNVSFTVSWVSAADTDGYILFWKAPVGPTTRVDDVRGASASGTTHSVDVRSLLPGETYFVDVVTGGTVDNNGGQHYRVITGPELAPRQPATIYGRAARAGGASPAGILVYAVVLDADGSGSPDASAPLSTIIREPDQGYWSFNLDKARLSDLSGPFVLSAADNVRLQLVGGAGQVVEATVQIGAAAPAPLLVVPAAPTPAVASPVPTASPTAVPPPAAPTVTPGASPTVPPAAPSAVASATRAAAAPTSGATVGAVPTATAGPRTPAPTILPTLPAAPGAAPASTVPPADSPPLPPSVPGPAGDATWLLIVAGLAGALLLIAALTVALITRYRSR